MPTDNIRAYNLYHLATYDVGFSGNFELYNNLLNEAISLDSNFATAYADLGWSWLARGAWMGDLEPNQFLEKALTLFEKAKEINNDLPTVHEYLARAYLWYQWDFYAVQKEIKKFNQLNPSNYAFEWTYCNILNASGRFQEALELTEKTVLENPKDCFGIAPIGLSYYFSGLPEKAIEFYETANQLFRKNIYLIMESGRIYVYTKRYEDAINIAYKYLSLNPNRPPRIIANLAIAYYHTNNNDKTERILTELTNRIDTTSVGRPAIHAAMIYAQMGEADLAFEYLDKAYDTHEMEMYWLKVEPHFKPLYNDPRWEIILDKVGFPE
jgi:tetratricopeptide (TPR) repeat protein